MKSIETLVKTVKKECSAYDCGLFAQKNKRAFIIKFSDPQMEQRIKESFDSFEILNDSDVLKVWEKLSENKGEFLNFEELKYALENLGEYKKQVNKHLDKFNTLGQKTIYKIKDKFFDLEIINIFYKINNEIKKVSINNQILFLSGDLCDMFLKCLYVPEMDKDVWNSFKFIRNFEIIKEEEKDKETKRLINIFKNFFKTDYCGHCFKIKNPDNRFLYVKSDVRTMLEVNKNQEYVQKIIDNLGVKFEELDDKYETVLSLVNLENLIKCKINYDIIRNLGKYVEDFKKNIKKDVVVPLSDRFYMESEPLEMFLKLNKSDPFVQIFSKDKIQKSLKNIKSYSI